MPHDKELVERVARGLCNAWASDPARAASWLPLSSIEAMARYALDLAERAAGYASGCAITAEEAVREAVEGA